MPLVGLPSAARSLGAGQGTSKSTEPSTESRTALVNLCGPRKEEFYISVNPAAPLKESLGSFISPKTGICRILVDGVSIGSNETYDSFDPLGDSPVIDLFPELVGGGGSNEPDELAPEAASGKKKLNITVKISNYEELQFKMKYTTTFEKIFNAIASAKNVAPDSFRLIYDGHRISSSENPKMLEMDDNAQVDYTIEVEGGSFS